MFTWHTRGHGLVKFVANRPYANPETAARLRLVVTREGEMDVTTLILAQTN
jgi:hypothetical protein